tara:strand:+ start:910 stop:1554 length:645 start_codon:yes stop_codon:yes gene_type:complete
MDEKSNGLILRVHPFSDSSLMVQWLTPAHGRLTTSARGGRRPKSAFYGKLDLLFEANFSYRLNKRSDIHTLREMQLSNSHPAIRKDVRKLQLMAYATRFVEQTTEPNTPIFGIHAIFTSLLEHLSTAAPRPALAYALEMKLLNELGLSPALEDSRLTEPTTKLLEQLTIGSWRSIESIKPTHSQVKEMREYLHGFLVYHLGKLPKGRKAALALS